MLSEEPLYQLANDEQTCWISPENPTGARGCGGQTNRGAKGTAYIQLKGNSQAVLCDVDGPGVIQQIWMTTSSLLGDQGLDGHPRAYMLRAIKVQGRGRFIGANFCVITNPAYCKTWWGEGEVKIYLDGDQNYPSLCGTGTEDYVGTGWGQRIFQNRYQGNLMISDVRGRENSNIYSFYRYHVPDPVYFYQDIKVAIQVMGSASGKRVLEFIDEGVSLIPVSAVIDQFGNHFKFEKLLDSGESLSPEAHDEAGVCFYRSDDWAVNAYFYFDKPASDLPGIASVDERTYMIRREKTEEGG